MFIFIREIIKRGREQMKKYIDTAFIYAILAMICGVFYREFTKLYGFTGKTALAFSHLHLFALGTIVFLIIAIFSQFTDLEKQKSFNRFFKLYNVALPLMVIMFVVRGVLQVLQTNISTGADAAISGIADISHIMLAVSIVFLFTALRNSKRI